MLVIRPRSVRAGASLETLPIPVADSVCKTNQTSGGIVKTSPSGSSTPSATGNDRWPWAVMSGAAGALRTSRRQACASRVALSSIRMGAAQQRPSASRKTSQRTPQQVFTKKKIASCTPIRRPALRSGTTETTTTCICMHARHTNPNAWNAVWHSRLGAADNNGSQAWQSSGPWSYSPHLVLQFCFMNSTFTTSYRRRPPAKQPTARPMTRHAGQRVELAEGAPSKSNIARPGCRERDIGPSEPPSPFTSAR